MSWQFRTLATKPGLKRSSRGGLPQSELGDSRDQKAKAETDMNSRERVLKALQREQPDRVPYCELAVDRALAQQGF